MVSSNWEEYTPGVDRPRFPPRAISEEARSLPGRRPWIRETTAASGTMVLLFTGEGKERVEVASCVPRIGKPERWDLRGPKIDLQ